MYSCSSALSKICLSWQRLHSPIVAYRHKHICVAWCHDELQCVSHGIPCYSYLLILFHVRCTWNGNVVWVAVCGVRGDVQMFSSAGTNPLYFDDRLCANKKNKLGRNAILAILDTPRVVLSLESIGDACMLDLWHFSWPLSFRRCCSSGRSKCAWIIGPAIERTPTRSLIYWVVFVYCGSTVFVFVALIIRACVYACAH